MKRQGEIAAGGESAEEEEEEDGYASASSTLDHADGVEMSQDDKTRLREIFNHFDENRDGRICRDEMARSLHRLGIPVSSAEELTSMIEQVDSNSDGFVDFLEFSNLYSSLISSNKLGQRLAPSGAVHMGVTGGLNGANGDADSLDDEVDDLLQAFKVFDKNDDGLISAEELHNVLSKMGLLQGRTLLDCMSMINKVDADGNGQVDFQEFKKMMAP